MLFDTCYLFLMCVCTKISESSIVVPQPDYTYLKPFNEKDLHFLIKPGSAINIEPMISIFGANRCLLIVDNFYRLQVKVQTYPVILRHYFPATFYKKIRVKDQSAYFRAYLTFIKENVNASSMECPGSKHWVPVHHQSRDQNVRGHCIELDFDNFSSSSKTWNCEAHAMMFPIMARQGSLGRLKPFNRYPFTFAYVNYSNSWLQILPSSIPRIRVFIYKILTSFESLLHTILTTGGPRQSITPDGYSQATHNLVLYLEAGQFSHNISEHLQPIQFEIQYWYLLCLCESCSHKATLQIVEPTLLLTSHFPHCLKPGEKVYLDKFGNSYEAFDPETYPVRAYLSKCYNTSLKKHFKTHRANQKSNERIALAYTHEWTSIFANYTYIAFTKSGRFECLNGVKVRRLATNERFWKNREYWDVSALTERVSTHPFTSLAEWPQRS